MTELAVASEQLTKRFGRQVAVNAVGLAVPRGSVYGFLGPNGSGKTTTIRMLLGLIRPTAGTHRLFGEPMPERAGRVLPRVGALVEGPAFHPYLSGRDNLRRLDAADRTAEPRTAGARIGAALERVGLSAAAGKRHSEQDGAVVLGAQGAHYLSSGRIEGIDPLSAFSPTAPQHLLRTDGFEHVADIMVGSFYDAALDEGCAFEELISFHGGLGGSQTRPFLLYPESLPLPNEPIVGAASVNLVLRGWRTQLNDGAQANGQTRSEPDREDWFEPAVL